MKNFPKQIMSIDVESASLWGQPISVGIALIDNGHVVDSMSIRYDYDVATLDPWVQENVHPHIKGMNTVDTYQEMLTEVSTYYLQHKDAYTVVYHMGHVVEAGLFRELVRMNLIGPFEGPYTPIEISMLLQSQGFAPDSVDGYLQEKNLQISEIGRGLSTHNPLYDCLAASAAYYDLIGS